MDFWESVMEAVKLPEDLLAVAAAAVEAALRRAADAAEAYVSAGRELVVEVRHGQVETLKQAEEKGIGVLKR